MKAIPNYLLVALLLLSLSLMTGCEATDVPTAPEATPAFAAKSGTNCVTPPSGLVSWWPGDGNADDIVDGNPGILQGGTSFATGKVGPAFSFGGVVNQPFGTDFVLVGDRANLKFGTGSFSVEAWVKRGAFPELAFRPIVYSLAFTSTPGFGFALEQIQNSPDFDLRFDLGDGTTRIFFHRGPITDTEFHHVAMVVDRSIQRGKVYVDGVQAGADIDISSIGSVSGSEQISIGKAPGNPHTFFGLIDEVEIYNRALSASEIQAIFNAGSAGKCKIGKTVTICHKPGTPAQETKVIPFQALAGHLGHGDTAGPC